MDANRSGFGSSVRDKRKYYQEQAVQQAAVSARISNLETSEKHLIRMVQLSSLFLDGVALTSGVDYTPPVSPTAALGVDHIQGIFANFWISPEDSTRDIFFGSSDDTLSSVSQRYRYQCGGADTNRQVMTQCVIIAVGVDGNIKIQSTGGNSTGYMTIFGYWL